MAQMREAERKEDGKMEVVSRGVERGSEEVRPHSLGRVAQEILRRQPLNPFSRMTLIPIPSWSGSMIESNHEAGG